MAPVEKNADIEVLYKFFKAVRQDPKLGIRLARLIESLSTTTHPGGKEVLGEFEIGEIQFMVDLSDRFGRACFYGSDQERTDLAIFSSLCTPGSIVWDIGANFGLYSIICACKPGFHGRIYAAEPHRRAAKLLRQNVERNSVGNRVTLFEEALSDRDGTATFFEASETAFSGLSNTGRASLESTNIVTTYRLDTLWKKTGALPIDLIKIDVEGHEGAVLEGALEAIGASPDLIVQFEFSPKNVTHQLEAQIRRVLMHLQDTGWALWRISYENEDLQRFRVHEMASPMGDTSGNIFLVREESEREKSLLNAARDALSSHEQLDSFTHAEISKGLELLFTETDQTFHMERASYETKTQTIRTTLEQKLETERQSRVALEQKSSSALEAEKKARAKLEVLENTIRSQPPLLLPDPRILSKESPQAYRPISRALRPEVLSHVETLSVIIRVMQDSDSLRNVLDQLPALCGKWPYTIIIADCRKEPGASLTIPDAIVVTPPFRSPKVSQEKHHNRYAIALRAALLGSETSHILLLDAGDVLAAGSLELATHFWRQKALETQSPIAAIAFPVRHSSIIRTKPRFEETLGGMLVLRRGLVSSRALQFVGLPPHDRYVGDGFDADLSLRLWYNGLDIREAPADISAETSNIKRPHFHEEDLKLLAEHWRGIYAHPLISKYFKQPGTRTTHE